MADSKVIVVTGASSGFGDLTARALARAGHVVYAGTRWTRWTRWTRRSCASSALPAA